MGCHLMKVCIILGGVGIHVIGVDNNFENVNKTFGDSLLILNIFYSSPNNPEGLTALWVGNVLPEVSEKKLTQMFSK